MALLNLYGVTETLINLITRAIDASKYDLGLSSELLILPEPPVINNKPGLGVYLYHIAEDPHFMNCPPPGRDWPPVAFIPMGLNLYYQLSAHSPLDDGTGPKIEQQLMGVAMKALHEYPEINDYTTYYGSMPEEKIMAIALAGHNNRLRIKLQPKPPDEAVSFWTAGDSPVKLAAYYEVSVIFLEPRKPRTRAGRVLSYGVHTFTAGTPRLLGSENEIRFTVEEGLLPQTVTLRPAQSPPLPSGADPGDAHSDSRITFTGTGLSGENREILILHPGWDKPLVATENWIAPSGQDQVCIQVRETLDDPSGTAKDIIPGHYSAQVRTTRRRRLSNGDIRELVSVSNQCPFTVTPKVDGITKTGITGQYLVEGYGFQYAVTEEIPVGGEIVKNFISMDLYLGEHRLTEATAGSPVAGEFVVVNGNEILFNLPDDLPEDQPILPLRIFANGAESQPRWINLSE